MPSRFEIEGRADKAWKLARLLRARGYSFQDAAEFEDSQWETLADLAKLKKAPSERTKGMVVGFLTPAKQLRTPG